MLAIEKGWGHKVLRYGVAIILPTLTFAAVAAHIIALPNEVKYLIAYPLIFFITWFAGWKAGLVSTIVSFFGAILILTPPLFVWDWPADLSAQSSLFSMLAFGILVVFLRKLYERSKTLEVQASAEFSSVFNLAASGMIQSDPQNNRILRVNQRFCDMVGYSEKELVGRHFSEITHPDDRDWNYEAFQNLVKQRTSYVRLEKRYIHKNGSVIWASVDASLVKGATGKAVRSIAVVQDITQRKLADMALRASELKFCQLAEAMPQFVWISNAVGEIAYYNQRYYQYTGLTPEECLQTQFTGAIHPEDLPHVKRSWFYSIGAKVTYQSECRLRGADGSYRWFLCRGYPMKDDAGEIIQWIGTCTDVEKHRKQEEDLRKAVLARDEFLSIASHELKTPLTSLKLQLQMALRQTKQSVDKTLPPERLNRLFGVSLKQTDRLTRLVEDLIDVSRIQSGQLTYHFELTNINDVVKEVADRLSVDSLTQTIQVDVPLVPVVIVCDQNRIEQVISNLISNAFKYANGKAIKISVFLEKSDVCIAVADKGIGIPEDKQKLIFERFERAHASSGISGLGLGLFIAKQICESHGGSIAVASVPGEGSTFTVRLPLGPVGQMSLTPHIEDVNIG